MFVRKTLLYSTKTILLRAGCSRHYASLYEKEFTVKPFCSINVNVPFNVTMTPLDVYKYKDCDKVIVKISSNTKNSVANLECNQEEDNISVFTSSNEFPQDTICKIKAPIKANINVTTAKGNISLINFNGESITLKSELGNIAATKCQCNKISFVSSAGNITCLNVMQAAEIYLKTSNNGSIVTGRLQGLDLKMETEHGSMKTESSYCHSSTFITETGQLDLQSTHKNCNIIIRKKGILNMTGFDGTLLAMLHEGAADIQLSRIQGDSKIKIEGNGSLKLKVSQTCLESTTFKIISENVQVDKDLKQKLTIVDRHLAFISENEPNSNVLIDCEKSDVIVEGLSWMEMFNIKRSV